MSAYIFSKTLHTGEVINSEQTYIVDLPGFSTFRYSFFIGARTAGAGACYARIMSIVGGVLMNVWIGIECTLSNSIGTVIVPVAALTYEVIVTPTLLGSFPLYDAMDAWG